MMGEAREGGGLNMGTDGEVANALVCKTSIHGFKSHSVLQLINNVASHFVQIKVGMCGKMWVQFTSRNTSREKLT
jgi:hypothetical protein